MLHKSVLKWFKMNKATLIISYRLMIYRIYLIYYGYILLYVIPQFIILSTDYIL